MNESPERASPTRRALEVLVALAVALQLAVLLYPERLGATRTLDVRTSSELAPLGSGTARAIFATGTLLRVPRSARLLEDGRPLERVLDAAALATGSFVGAGRVLSFESSDGTSPLENGRRYELAFEPDTVLALASLPGLALCLFTGAVFLAAIRNGAIRITETSPARTRAALALTATLALGLGVAKSWDSIAIDRDSQGYLDHAEIRPPLYPAFLDLFTRHQIVHATPTPGQVRDASHPLIGVVHAQRVLLLGSLVVLVLALSSSLNAWLVGGLLYLGALIDTERLGGSSSVAWNAGSIMSEGINHPLVFLLCAAVFEYLRRPGWARGAVVSLVLALLLANRPANAPLAAALFLIWLFHTAEEGWRAASVRAGGLALLVALPLLFVCESHREAHGRFRLHAFTGPSLFGLALESANEEDAAAFEEPELRRFVEACVQDPRRVADYRSLPRGDYLNLNLYEIGIPAAERTLRLPPGEEAWALDDALQTVSKRLLRRHPGDVAAIVLFHLGRLLDPARHALVALAFVGAAALWRRTRAPELLFAAGFAALPLVYMLPTCVFNFPSERYRSQVYFAEFLALPFLLAVLLSLGKARLRGRAVAP